MKKKTNYILLIIFALTFFISGVSAKECYVCGEGAMAIPTALPMFTSNIMTIIQIAVPVVLIVSSLVRYSKVVLSDPLKSGMDTNKSFIRSIIAAVIVFIMIAIVRSVFDSVDKLNGSSSSTSCINCFINGNCGGATTCPSRQEAIDSIKKGSTTHQSESGTTHGGGGGEWDTIKKGSTTHQSESGTTHGGGGGEWGSTTHQSESGTTHGGGGGEW